MSEFHGTTDLFESLADGKPVECKFPLELLKCELVDSSSCAVVGSSMKPFS